MTRIAVRPLAAIALAGALAGGVSCDDPAGFTGLTQDPQNVFWDLDLNQHAVNLSTDPTQPQSNTYQLVALPYRLDGSPFEGAIEVEWTTADTNRVKVDATGKLTAKGTTSVTSPVRIIARAVGGPGPVMNADTAFVTVTSTAQVPASLSIQPYRTTYGIGWDTSLVATVVDEAGMPIPNLRIDYESSLPIVANYSATGLFQPMTMGTATIRASAAIYGQELEDEVVMTVDEPEVLQVNIGYFITPDGAFDTYFDPEVVTIKAGMGVAWNSLDGIAATIVFDDPTNVGPSPADGKSGDPGFSFAFGLTRVIRTFPVPGTYHYRDAAAGKTAEGTIIVEP